MIIKNIQPGLRAALLALCSVWLLYSAEPAFAANFVHEPAGGTSLGAFNGVEYVQYRGRFMGETAQGVFNVPFEIIAPADPREGNRTVLVEPPHFTFGAAGLGLLGADLLFGRGLSYASVGFSNNGFNILDSSATDVVIAGQAVGFQLAPPFVRDVEIITQFSEALSKDPFATSVLGKFRRMYAFGVSQSAEALFEVFFATSAEDLFDLTVVQVPLWRPPFADPQTLAVLPDDFYPPPNVGKVMIVTAEGDQFISESVEFRNAVRGPDKDRRFRVYEVAGAPHIAFPPIPNEDGDIPNPLEIAPVVRALFVAGDRWVKHGWQPPRSALLRSSRPGATDPVYGVPTGISRDADGNARGGVRLPDVAVGRALFQASTEVDFVFRFFGVPGLIGLAGQWYDLACEPPAGSHNDKPRFRSHRQYVRGVKRQIVRLLLDGLLLRDDAIRMLQQAADSDVGKPGTC